MSLDRSLRGANTLIRHRNVLTRAERLDKLKEEEKWDDSKSVYGLPKVEHRKQVLAKAVKEEVAVDGAAAVAGAAAPAAGGAAPAAAGAKGAAPAAGAKGAAAPAGAAGKSAAPAAKGAGAPAAKGKK